MLMSVTAELVASSLAAIPFTDTFFCIRAHIAT